MKTIKPMTLGVLHRPYPHLGRNRMVVAALGFFRLGADNERLLEDNLQWPLVLPLLPAGIALDEVMPKARAEALLLGRAWAPGGKPVTCMCARMQVGAIDKTLRVVGPRQWRRGMLARHQVDPPAPFVTMPLDAAHAYGGPGHPGNPLGVGYAGAGGPRAGAMPNLEVAGAPVDTHARLLTPAGFGPLPSTWAPRAGKYGSYGARWLREEAPGFASDIDWSVFNLAQPDQWLDGYFDGGEAYRLEGLHPRRPLIAGRLPRMRVRAFLLPAGAEASACAEVVMRLDTVWFLPEQELGILAYHGEHEIADSDGLDVGTLMVGYEHADQPKPLSHYHQVLAWRGDVTTATLHAFDEGQLAPALSAATVAARAAAEQASAAAALAQRQRVLDELDAEHWRRMGRAAPAGHEPPRAPPMPPGAPSPQALASHDFSLTEMVGQAKARAEATRQAGKAKLARLRGDPDIARMAAAAGRPDPAQQFEAALQRAIVPAYDLFPAEQTGRDPQSAEQAAQLDRAHAAGHLDDARYQRALAALAGAPALKRGGRRAAPRRAGPPLAPSAALKLGEQVRLWLSQGVALAGRDLAGADLRGIVLDHADLREVMLEGADLRGASLRGADLRRAVLTEARLEGADLAGATLDEANLSHSDAARASFAGASLGKVHAIEAAWPSANLREANLDGMLAMRIDLSGAVLERARARAAVLIEARADGSNWRGATLESVAAMRASLARADFSEASLVSCAVIDADLAASTWRAARLRKLQGSARGTRLRGADLRGVRAEDCGLHGADLADANFTAAHLMRCDLGAAILRGALLERAHLPHSNLMAADLRGASLRGAYFYQAICRKADFSGAALAGARFVQSESTGARMPATVEEPGA